MQLKYGRQRLDRHKDLQHLEKGTTAVVAFFLVVFVILLHGGIFSI